MQNQISAAFSKVALGLTWIAVCSATSSAMGGEPRKNSFEENLTLRRIAEYWKEGEFVSVKSQIRSFLSAYPESTYADSLNAMLGDLFFNEKNYLEACETYQKIQDPTFQKQTHYQLLYSLYQEGLFDAVTASATPFIEEKRGSKEQEEMARFFLADALYQLGKKTDHSQAKTNLYSQSMAHFKQLQQTSHAPHTLYPMAVMYTHLKENEKAAALYEQLAELHPQQKEEFLFQAASLYLPTNKNAAVTLYGKVYLLDGRHAADAAFNQIQLLFAQKRFKDLLTAQENAIKYVPLEHLPLMRYYIGKSLFALGDYPNAANYLSQFLENECPQERLLRNACAALIQCAHKTRNLSLFNQSLARLNTHFPKEEITCQSLLLHAHFCREIGELAAAQRDLQSLIHQFPNHVNQDAFRYDEALLFAQLKQWEAGASAFKNWLMQYPKSAQRSNAYRHLLACQAELIKEAPPETALVRRQDLVTILHEALGQKKLFSSEEQKHMQFCLGNTLYETAQYDQALNAFSEYVERYPQGSKLPEAYLGMTYCYIKGAFDPQGFALCAEQALALNETLPQREALHLELYNTYLDLAASASDAEKGTYIDQAAHHLFSALRQPLHQDNYIWLANHYIKKFQTADSQAIEKDLYLSRSIAILEWLLDTMNIQNPSIEREALRLSQLYIDSYRYNDAANLLQALQEAQRLTPDASWQYQRLTAFELGRVYEHLLQWNKALNIYDDLISSSSHAYSYFGTAARLRSACIEFDQLDPKEKQEEAEVVQNICNELKNLQIQRKLSSEPWHLEAALSYIDIKVELAPPSHRLDLRLQLLKQVKEEFTASHDPLTKQYLIAAEQFPEQWAIYKQYLHFMESEEERLTSHSNRQKNVSSYYDDLLKQPINAFLKYRIQHLPCL